MSFNLSVTLLLFCLCTPDCACNAEGVTGIPKKLLCNGTTGQCDCKLQVTGRTCSKCRKGYWKLSQNNSDGCEGNHRFKIVRIRGICLAGDDCLLDVILGSVSVINDKK